MTAGDVLVCQTDNSASGTQVQVGAQWVVISTASGAVSGPASSTDGDVAVFSGVTGELLKDTSLSAAALAELVHEMVVGASTAALGTDSGTAAVLPDATGGVYPVTAADGTVGVRLHADDKVLDRRIMIVNEVTNKILKIYPPTGGTINGAAADAAFATLSGSGAILICTNATTNAWIAYN